MRTLPCLAIILAVAGLIPAQGAITSLSPSLVAVNSAAFTLSVNGSGFSPLNIVQFNGGSLTTTFVSSTQLTAAVPAPSLTTTGVFGVRVKASLISLSFSNTVNFTVGNAVPILTSISPASATAGGNSFLVTANGSGFAAAADVRLNGTTLATNFVSATQLTATVPAAQIATAGTKTITVFNPAPLGGTSSGRTLTINNPVPALTTISPTSVTALAAPPQLTATGSNFNSQSRIRVDGADLATTLLSATQVRATLLPAHLAAPGSLGITVFNPTPGGGTTSTATLSVVAPVPVLTSVSPSAILIGSADTTITLAGTEFLSTSSARWGGISLATTFVSNSSLTALVPATLLATVGSVNVTVFTPSPGGGASAARTVTVENPVPVAATLTPSLVSAQATAFILRVNGSGFVSGAQIVFGGVAMGTAFFSSSDIRTTVFAASIPTPGPVAVVVLNPAPGGGTSNTLTLTVGNPDPLLTSVAPASVTRGGPAFTLTANGSRFVSSSTVTFNGTPLATTFLSDSLLTAAVPAALIATVSGNVPVTVVNPAPAGGTSSGPVVAVLNPVPAITTIAPAPVLAAGVPATITVDGSGFIPESSVRVNGAALATTLVSGTQVQATIPAGNLAAPGTLVVNVFNPAPGGGTSNSPSLPVAWPAPVLASIAPESVVIGTGPVSLTATGSGFTPASEVRFAGAPVPTTFVNTGSLQATIAASLIATLGTRNVDVVTPAPGGGISTVAAFAVVAPVPVLGSLAPQIVAAGSPATLIQVGGSGFQSNSTVLAGGSAVATTFVSGTTLLATVPSLLLQVPGTLGIQVSTPGPGGGSSGTLSLTIENAVPAITSSAPAAIPAGSVNLPLSLLGSGFSLQTAVFVDGLPVPVVLVDFNRVDAVIPTLTAAVTRALRIQAVNPAPGGGASAEIIVAVNGPMITLLAPPFVVTGPAAPVTVDVLGSGFNGGHLVRANGFPVPTTFIDSGHLQAQLSPALPWVQIPGGVIVTVTAGDLVSSNARDLPVGAPVPPLNRGTVSLSPAPPAPGAAFAVRVETPVHSLPVTLIADIAQPAPVALSVGPGATLMLGVLLGLPIPLADGLGVFGPPDGSALRDGILPVYGFGNEYGIFEIAIPAAPNPPLGITATLQAAYVDFSSPIGVSLTQALYPVLL